ncbi:MAG: DMT family transporter [Varibaculum cambriense]
MDSPLVSGTINSGGSSSFCPPHRTHRSLVRQRRSHNFSCHPIIAIGVFCFLAALPFGLQLPQDARQWTVLLYTVVFAAIGALIMQTWAQKHLRPTKAAVVMTMEPVFAAAFAVLFGGEDVTSRMIVGGSLVVAAMLATELIPAYRARDKIRAGE